MNTYRTLTELGKILYGPGEAELDLTVEQEADALSGGHLEIVPRKYKVTSNRYAGGQRGAEVTLALRIEPERMLLDGGHLARVEVEPQPGKADQDEPPADRPRRPKPKTD